MIKILFVCLGNVCRSPTAQGVFAHWVQQEGLSDLVTVDSAGTHAHFAGNPPDSRSQIAAHKRGIDLSGLRARQITFADFTTFDYVIAMDKSNYAALQAFCPKELEYKLHLFLDFAPQLKKREVPDPYEGGDKGFEQVFDLIETASLGLLAEIRQRLNK